jgi:hypothetical protein
MCQMTQSLSRRRSAPTRSTDEAGSAPETVHPFGPAPAVVFSHALLDTLMPKCDPYEWKIICAVLRHQDEKKLSVGKFMRWTGMVNRKTCFDSLTRCVTKGYVVRVPVGNSFAYRPNLALALQKPDSDERSW